MTNEPFHFKDWNELNIYAKELNIYLPYKDDFSILGKPVSQGGVRIKNRILVQPIEGFDAQQDGSPGSRSISRYCEMAQNGAGSIWLESVSVNRQGRSNQAQLWIRDDNVEEFRKLNKAVQAAAKEHVYTIMQLTHSGRNSNPDGLSKPICAFHSEAIKKEQEYIITDQELGALEDDYVHAAQLAQEAGFDAVDIRACHGYLINEFFAAYHREGVYGGCFENRVRLLLNIIDKIKRTCQITLAVRLNMYDGVPYPYGWGIAASGGMKEDFTEPLRLIRLLNEKGVRLINISSGIGAYSPYVIRPYDTGGIQPNEPQLCGVNRMLATARLAKKNAPDALIVASAFTWLREFSANIAAGGIEEGWFDLAGFGRQALAYPTFSADLLSGQGLNRAACCVTCCGCTSLIKKRGGSIRCIMKERLQKNREDLGKEQS